MVIVLCPHIAWNLKLIPKTKYNHNGNVQYIYIDWAWRDVFRLRFFCICILFSAFRSKISQHLMKFLRTIIYLVQGFLQSLLCYLMVLLLAICYRITKLIQVSSRKIATILYTLFYYNEKQQFEDRIICHCLRMTKINLKALKLITISIKRRNRNSFTPYLMRSRETRRNRRNSKHWLIQKTVHLSLSLSFHCLILLFTLKLVLTFNENELE